MSDPTDTPWRIVNFDRENDLVSIENADGGEVGDYYPRDQAERIVRAVNGHEAMRDVLRQIQWGIRIDTHENECETCPACYGDRCKIDADGNGPGHRPDCTLAAALALAERKD